MISRLKLESGEFDSKIKRAAQGIRQMADECHKAGGELNVLEDENREYIKSIGQMETVNKTARGSVAELTAAFLDMKKVYNELSEEEKNGEVGRELNKQLGILKQRIDSGNEELKSMQKELGGNGLSGALDQVAGKFGLNIKQLTGWGAALGAGKMALDVAKDAFFQSETNIDEWGRTLKGAEGAYQVFLDTLNNGNWSNFFQNLETAIRGGRDLYDVFDRLGSIKSNNAAAIAIVQQQIAQLRLAKQQGKDVDAQLKAATARLAALQKQSIQAGKAAGNQTAFNVIRNGVNSIGGARINDATIRLAVDQLMTGGQAQFDKFRNNYQILQRKGTRTVVQQLDDGMGGTVNKYRETFDINALTKEEQKQYAIAKAITEGETRIQVGISAFAQAVSEGTASAREEFKGNRYALQGSRGGGGTGGSGGGTSPVPVKIESFDISAAASAGVHGVDTMPSVWQMMGDEGLRKMLGIAPQQAFDLGTDISKGWQLDSKGQLVQKKDKDAQNADKTIVSEMGKLTSGVSGIFSGIEQMGIEVPDEIKNVINGLNGVMTILTSINTILGAPKRQA